MTSNVSPRCVVPLVLVLWLVLTGTARAHIGSPNVFFEGHAGPYPVRVVVRPPPVIPGLAEISVRVGTNGVSQVTALPMRWNTGRAGAPRPDVARPVAGETNLFAAQLWFMEGGAQSVEVSVRGRDGTGTALVPVSAVATRVLPMPRHLGAVLAGLGVLLFTLLISIVGAAVRQGVLPAGAEATPRRARLAWAAVVGSAALLALLLWGGKRWWDAEAAGYRNHRLHRPPVIEARVANAEARRVLRLGLVDERFSQRPPLVPDHGRLMHLFLMREPGLDAFAHLHPVRRDWKTFETVLPDLPAGAYRLYADITYESGLAETLTTRVEIPDLAESAGAGRRDSALEAEDSWRLSPPLLPSQPAEDGVRALQSSLGARYAMALLGGERLIENRETSLRFQVLDERGGPVAVQPYLGMLGHVIVRRIDGAVFTHLHPSGTYSMAARQLFEMRLDGTAPMKVARADEDPFCRLPTAEEIAAVWNRANRNPAAQPISFPYAFPGPGLYRLWAQVQIRGEVLTGVFDVAVAPASAR